MPPLRFARVETSNGPILAAETDAGIAAVGRATSLETFLEPLRRRFPGLEPMPGDLDLAWLTDAVEGGDAPLPVVDLRGLSAFDAQVYEAARPVPRGGPVPYGGGAGPIGSPGAARAVGGSMARFPLCPAVPCH